MENLLKICKQAFALRVTSSRVVSKGPAYLFSAHLVADDSGAATSAVLDGHSEDGDPMVDMAAPQSSIDARIFVPPLYFDKGIYVDVGLNVTSVLLQYRQTRDFTAGTKPSLLKSFLNSWFGGPAKEQKNA